MRPAAAAVLALVVLAAPAHARDRKRTSLARVAADSPLRTFRGVTAVSIRDGDRYALAVVRHGSVHRLAAAPQPYHPFEADVGPDTRGRPVVVYARAGDLFIDRLDGTTAEPVRTANSAARESLPSIWRGRVAWVREGARILTRNRLLARRTPSQRFGRVGVDEIEVHGRRVAAIVDGEDSSYEFGSQTLLLHDVGRGRTRRIWHSGAGIGGQRLHGLSFADGWLGWHRTCDGDEAGCDTGGPRRLRLSDGRYEWWTGWRPLTGFALLPGGGTLEIATRGRLERVSRPRWKRIPHSGMRR